MYKFREIIYKEGESSDMVYIVLDGEFKITKKLSIHIDHIKMGEYEYPELKEKCTRL